MRYGDGALFDVQDDYRAEPFAKRPKIEAHFRKAAAQPGKLYVNHVSTAALLPPRWNADRLNPQVHALMDSAEAARLARARHRPHGLPATRAGLVASLLRHN